MNADYEYDLELDRIVSEIKNQKPSTILLHLPDGLKPKAEDIQDYIQRECEDVKILIWAGSNFGACDLPVDVQRAGVEIIFHFGHSPWLS